MAVTQEDIDALKEALRSGVRVVQQGSNSVTYATSDEIRKTIREMEAELRGRRKVSYPSYNRGARG